MNIDFTKTQQYLEWLKNKLYLNAMLTHFFDITTVMSISYSLFSFKDNIYFSKYNARVSLA